MPRHRKGAVGQHRRVPRGMLHVPPAHTAHVAVCTGARAPPVATEPVAEVVPAPGLRRGRPVRHLVPPQPRRRQHRIDHLVALGENVVVGGRDLPSPHPARQRRAFLDDQRVRRHVIDTRVEHRVHRRPEVLGPLSGCAVDEVEVDVLEARRARLGGRAHRTAGGVHPVEHREDVPRRRLHAERHPGVAGLTQPREELRRRGLGVRLRGHLGVGGEAERRADRVQHVPQPVRAEQGRGSTAHEHRVRGRRSAQQLCREVEFPAQAVEPRLRRGGSAEFPRRVGVEVAVPAARRTERDVHVHAERTAAHPPHGGGGKLERNGRLTHADQCRTRRIDRGRRRRDPSVNPLSSTPRPARRRPLPTMRTVLDAPRTACDGDLVTSAGVFLVVRRHVDYLRVNSSLCRR